MCLLKKTWHGTATMALYGMIILYVSSEKHGMVLLGIIILCLPSEKHGMALYNKIIRLKSKSNFFFYFYRLDKAKLLVKD